MASRTVTSLPVIEKPVAPGSWDFSRANIDRIVLHTMDGTLDGTAAWFANPNRASLTSAHYGIGLSGIIYHFTDETNTAYANGNYGANQRSITIEHEDKGDRSHPRTNAMYKASAQLVADICRFYSIPCDSTHIKPHRFYSSTSCPGNLDVDRIIREAAAILAPSKPQEAITNQTRIPQLGNEEVGAIASKLHDLERDYKGALAQAGDLKRQLSETTKQLEECHQRPEKAPKPADATFTHPLANLFHRLALAIDGRAG